MTPMHLGDESGSAAWCGARTDGVLTLNIDKCDCMECLTLAHEAARDTMQHIERRWVELDDGDDDEDDDPVGATLSNEGLDDDGDEPPLREGDCE